MFFTANNAKLQVNGNEILASNAEISLNTSLQPNYTIKQRSTNDYAASNGIGGRMSFNYYITGRDYFKKFITGQGELPIKNSQILSGSFGGLNFDSGYLTSYSVNFSPNSPIVANATVVFFDELGGQFSGDGFSTETAPSDFEEETGILNGKDIAISHYVPIGPPHTASVRSGDISEFVAGSYNYQLDVKPVYLMNETKPSSVSFGAKDVNMNFETDNPTGYLPVSGNTARISVDLKNKSSETVENFTCSGILSTRNLAAAVGDYVKQTINVKQAGAQATTVYVAEIIDSYGAGGCVGIGTTSSEGNI